MLDETIEGFRLSPQQQRLWLQQQDSSVYRAQCSILIEGQIRAEFLKEALQKVVNRNEILRTTFHRRPGLKIPIQAIADTSKQSWRTIDLSHLDFREHKARIDELFQEEKHLFFNFQESPLLRSVLITLSDKQHVLLISLPSLCADSWTLKNLIKEIYHAYSACLKGEELLDEPVQYIQFSEWQNELLESEDSETGKAYWRKQPSCSVPILTLPFEEKPTKSTRFNPDVYAQEIGPHLVAAIGALAQRSSTTIATFLLACWQILLWRLIGQSDIVVGTVYSCRKYQELHFALGLFAKWLPVRCSFQGDFKFREILWQIDQILHDIHKWQEYFVWEDTELVGETIDFPIGFEFEEWPNKYCTDEVSFSLHRQYLYFEPFKVKLTCVSRENSITAEFHYDTDLITTESIQCLTEQFQTLVRSVADNPETAIGKLEILSDRQRQQLLWELNKTQTNYPQGKCIHHLFEQQAKQIPNNIALVFEDQQLTYADLNARANQLAHHLQRLGTKPETVVAICIERSASGSATLTLDLLVALLGILKAGGAYVPLDPGLPTERLAFMLQDAQPSVLLTQHHLLDKLPNNQVRIICLDTDWQAIAQECNTNPTSTVVTQNLAYIIYTSGSTGKPKGVAVEHRQILNYVYSIQETLNLPAFASFATVSTFAADLGNTVIFPSLCIGGCLHIISQERSSNPEALADYFHHHPIDCLKIVPSHIAALLVSSEPKKILPRQRLVLGGEALSRSLISQIVEQTSDCQIFNHYGPTEATVGALIYPIKIGQIDQSSQTIPIGRPIANTQIYLLDPNLQPVPFNVSGELYIGGAGLSRGYLNRPESTALNFIPNPFSNLPGERLYKTGDLARYLSDGNIEFLGRIDNQVKIHGFRVELGEIEAALAKHPAIRATVVLAREDEPDHKCLVAYIVSNWEQTPTMSDLRRFLRERLPDHMVPSAFVLMKTLPLTFNGKVDRHSLPAPDHARPESKATFVAPRTPEETVLADIWTQFLRLKQVSIHDNFFELGGDSILSIQIIGRANRAGLLLTPRQLFEHQTIAKLAAVAGKTRVIQLEQELVVGLIPLTPIQHWFFAQNLPDPHHWNQSVLLEARQALNPALLVQTVQYLLEHHDTLRLRFVKEETGWQQINTDINQEVPFTQLDLSALSELKQQSTIEIAIAELQASLNLAEGPLMRVALFDLGNQQPSRLLIAIHHLAVDGVSWRILLEDFHTVYQQLSRGETIQLLPKTTSFKQWAEQLREYAQSPQLQQEMNYWLLADPHKPYTHLPIDYPGGDNTEAEARTVSVEFSMEETQALVQKIPKIHQTQINDVLLTALVQTFAQWTRVPSLLVDLEGHGREEIFNDVNLSRTVGWFSTIFPVLLNQREASSPKEALKAIKDQMRSIPNRGIGYGVLRYLRSDKANKTLQLQTQPQAEIKFNYLGQFDQMITELSLFGLAQGSNEPSPRSLRGHRSHLLSITGIIAGNQLKLNWIYSKAIHRRVTVESLAQGFVEALRLLIIDCCDGI